MERSLIKEINKKSLDTFLRKNQFSTMLYSIFFTLVFTTKLTWESLVGEEGANIMADIIAYNATAPLKTREVISKASGDIPKIAVKRVMDEKDYNEYVALQAMSNTDQNALLDLIFDDITFCYNAVNARTEWMALQALSKGEIELNINNNNGLITATNVDFQIPSANKTPVATVWSDTSATPITDMQTVVATAKTKGIVLKYVIMRLEEFQKMVKTTEVKDQFGYYIGMKGTAKIAPNLQQINGYLKDNALPQIVTINQSLRFENGKHTRSVIQPWNAGYITYVTDLKIGKIKHGPIAEEQVKMPQVTRSKRGHVLISKWSTMEPFNELTKGQANAFPTFNDASAIFIQNTTSTKAF